MNSPIGVNNPKSSYIPKEDIDIIKLSALFIKENYGAIFILGLIWSFIFGILALPIALLYVTIGRNYLFGSITTPPSNSSLLLIISLIVIVFIFFYFLYFIYQTSLFYLIKGLSQPETNYPPLLSIKKAFSKVPYLILIYFWRIIYTILIPLLPYATGSLLLSSGVSPIISVPLLLIGPPIAIIYGAYIIVKTTFVLIYPIEKEKWDGNAFFEALEFTKGYWLYIFSILVLLRIINALLIKSLSSIANLVYQKIDNNTLLILIQVLISTIIFYIGVFFNAGRYFLFKRLEYIKAEKKKI